MQDSAIFVAVDIVVFSSLIDQAHTDIGTMIGDSFIVGKGLNVREGSIDSAFTFFQALDVAFLESLFHDVDNLFQRFDAVGNRNVLFSKGMDCLGDAFADRIA